MNAGYCIAVLIYLLVAILFQRIPQSGFRATRYVGEAISMVCCAVLPAAIVLNSPVPVMAAAGNSSGSGSGGGGRGGLVYPLYVYPNSATLGGIYT
eukprot:COSAG01_NODE_2260_length_8057_cov_50.825527_4_plen_96_part_00